MRSDALLQFMDAFGDIVYNSYNATEAGLISAAVPADLRVAPDTAGRAVVGTDLLIVDDDGAELGPGEVGRILVRSDSQFEGYTSGDSKDFHESYMVSGDVGRLDDAGRLFVVGRDDEMIVSGGENVYPLEVEETLGSHDAVLEAVVVGVDDRDFGQRLAAYVVLQGGAEASAADLKQHVKGQLAGYKVPREVTFLDELPRNASGKVMKRELVPDPSDQTTDQTRAGLGRHGADGGRGRRVSLHGDPGDAHAHAQDRARAAVGHLRPGPVHRAGDRPARSAAAVPSTRAAGAVPPRAPALDRRPRDRPGAARLRPPGPGAGRHGGAREADRADREHAAGPLGPALGDPRLRAVRRRPGGLRREDAPRDRRRQRRQRPARTPHRPARPARGGRHHAGRRTAPAARPDPLEAHPGVAGAARRDPAAVHPARARAPHDVGRRGGRATTQEGDRRGAPADPGRAADLAQRHAHRPSRLRDVQRSAGGRQDG